MISVETRDGLRVAADVWSVDTERAPVLLVHGLGFARRHWRRQVAALNEAGFTAVTVDLRGFGDSELPAEPYDMAALAIDLEAVRAAAALERVHLVGHSMGGMVAQRYALDAPDRVASLVLASTTCHNGRRAAAFARAMAMLSEEGFDGAMANPSTRATVESILAEVVPYVGQVLSLLRNLTLEPDKARALAWQAIAQFSARDEIANVRCPTLVVHGSADQNIPFDAGRLLAEAITGAEWVPLDGIAHDLPIVAAEVFNAHLLRFLARVEA